MRIPYLSGLGESQWVPNVLLDFDITEDLFLSQEREKIVTES